MGKKNGQLSTASIISRDYDQKQHCQF